MDTEVPCGKVVPAMDEFMCVRWDEFFGGSPAKMRVEAWSETAAARIRTWEPLRDETLNLAPFPSLATAARPRSPRDVEKDSRSTQLDCGARASTRRRPLGRARWQRESTWHGW